MLFLRYAFTQTREKACKGTTLFWIDQIFLHFSVIFK